MGSVANFLRGTTAGRLLNFGRVAKGALLLYFA